RERRRAERRRQREEERNGAPSQPNPPSPFPEKEGGDPAPFATPFPGEPVAAPSPPSFPGNGAGGLGCEPPLTSGEPPVDVGPWVPDAPSANGDLVALSQEQWEQIMRELLGPDYPLPPE